MFRKGDVVTCIDGTNCDRVVRAGKTYQVALFRTAAEAIGVSTEDQVWIEGTGKWLEARRFEVIP
jgi:hypothetical protein